jgi:cytochrome P450
LEPGTYLPVNDFPILKLFPNRWNSGKQRAEDTFRMVTRIYGEARQRVDKRRMAGDKRGCLVDRFLDGDLKSDVPLNDSTLNQFLGTLLAAAVSTTLSATRTHILFLAKYPQFQEKAQVELDRICGSERMPVWSDFAQLPYINCIIKEGLRIRTV